MIQIKEDFSAQSGSHSIKLGANYNDLQNLGIVNANEHFATLTFFDDPSVILSNTQRPLPAGLPDAGDRPAVAAGQRRRDQRPGLPVGYHDRRAAVRRLVPGRLARDVEPDAEPRGALRHRLQPDGPGAPPAERDAHRARGDRESIWRVSRVVEAEHLAARGLRVRPVRRRTQGAARRLRPLFRPVQHRSRGRRHHRARPAAAERPGHAHQHRDRRRRTGDLPLRHRPASRRSRPRAIRCRATPRGSGSLPTSRIRAPTSCTSATPTRLRRTRCCRWTTRTSRAGTRCGRSISIRSSTGRACWRPISSGCSAWRTTSATSTSGRASTSRGMTR